MGSTRWSDDWLTTELFCSSFIFIFYIHKFTICKHSVVLFVVCTPRVVDGGVTFMTHRLWYPGMFQSLTTVGWTKRQGFRPVTMPCFNISQTFTQRQLSLMYSNSRKPGRLRKKTTKVVAVVVSLVLCLQCKPNAYKNAKKRRK